MNEELFRREINPKITNTIFGDSSRISKSRRIMLRNLASLAIVLAVSTASAETVWIDALKLGVEGQGWSETKAPYDRLPAKAEGVVRKPVWSLSRHSAGLRVRFVTNATTISARWKVTSPSLAMVHMPATGVSGLDLYAKTEKGFRWAGVGRPTKQETTTTLIAGMTGETREFLVYLPLYNGVESLEIGVPSEAIIKKAPTETAKPIVYWGTSITHGACASRPGMTHSAILHRRLNRPFINLGFSGNGRLESEVAELVAEIDASIYVLDCLPNLTAPDIAARTVPAVKIIRKQRPNTPIIMAEDRTYANAWLLSKQAKRNTDSRKAFRKAYEELVEGGVEKLYYLPGESQLGDDSDDTVDSSHPTDLGFLRMADSFEKVIRKIETDN